MRNLVFIVIAFQTSFKINLLHFKGYNSSITKALLSPQGTYIFSRQPCLEEVAYLNHNQGAYKRNTVDFLMF